MKPLVVIPARGGSKRIPRKNMCRIDGVPAIVIQISRLIEMGIFEDIIVSTDDKEIAKISSESGAKVVLRTDEKLSDDYTPSEFVVRDFIFRNQLNDSSQPIFCIYPLALLLDEDDLKLAIQIHKKSPGNFVISAGIFEPNPLRHSFKFINESIEILFPENNQKRSQDLEITYFDCGMFYLADRETWMNEKKFWYNNNSKLVIIPKIDAIDVDTIGDLIRLEKRFKEKYLRSNT